MTPAEAQARRVLASMLLGATADEIHARQPGWSLLALRTAARLLGEAVAGLASEIEVRERN